jgi:hypothetical protein
MKGYRMAASVVGIAGVIPMDSPGTYLHWGVIQISLANLIVIALMLVVFAVALVARFPRGKQ